VSERILPTIDGLNRPFWDGCREARLTVQRCAACERLRYPISPVCPYCLGREWTWQALAGTGAVYTFAVFRHAYNDACRDRVPYTVAIVELDEGVMMIGDVVGIAPEEVSVGMPVRVDFEPATEEIVIPRFVPAEG
jgi:uncharacterized OB-fold protein